MSGSAIQTIALITAVSLITACAGAGQVASGGVHTVSGTTRFKRQALPGGTVTASKETPDGIKVTATIGSDGSFAMDVGKGVYYLTGRSRDPETGEDLWSFWGGNPLNVFGDIPVTLVLPFTAFSPPPEMIEDAGIRGAAIFDGAPIEGVQVSVYLDPVEGFHGPPYSVSRPSDAQGLYNVPVGPGTYYLVARKRLSGDSYLGPLKKGDLIGYYPHNPVTVRGGGGISADIALVEVNRPRGQGSLSPGESIVMTGTITDERGLPVRGVRACLYREPEMLGRPDFVSSPTDSDGIFRLEVSREGVFYLAARSRIGGPPETGELMGYYRGSEDHSVNVQWGDRLTALDITVKEVW
jgi:hypothetical protein